MTIAIITVTVVIVPLHILYRGDLRVHADLNVPENDDAV